MKSIGKSKLPKTTYSVAEARVELSDIGGDAHYNRTVVHVQKRGVPYFAIVSDDDAKILEFIRTQDELLKSLEAAALRPAASAKQNIGEKVSALPRVDDGIR